MTERESVALPYQHEPFPRFLRDRAEQVLTQLRRNQLQLVLAESCTAGLGAAALGGVPGASEHFCGSAVVYQEATKCGWLGVGNDLLANFGAVSHQVAKAMTDGLLERTPQASVVAAITGHLGPNAPAALDGVLYISVQERGRPAAVRCVRLSAATDLDGESLRERRQVEAAVEMLECVITCLRKDE